MTPIELAQDDVIHPLDPTIGYPCMAIVGSVELPEGVRDAELAWSGVDVSKVHCGALATVWVGFNACPVHGAQFVADRIGRALFRATGRRLDAVSVAEQEWHAHCWDGTCPACREVPGMAKGCPDGERLLRRFHRLSTEWHRRTRRFVPEEVVVLNAKTGRSTRLSRFDPVKLVQPAARGGIRSERDGR